MSGPAGPAGEADMDAYAGPVELTAETATQAIGGHAELGKDTLAGGEQLWGGFIELADQHQRAAFEDAGRLTLRSLTGRTARAVVVAHTPEAETPALQIRGEGPPPF